ncbi:MAG: VCBS repeat-containing protein [Myxococcota bacterium]
MKQILCATVGVALASVGALPAHAIEYFSPPTDLGSAADWTNYIRLVDIDGDLDPDVLVPNCGGFFTTPVAQPFRIFRNDGGTFTDVTLQSLGVVPTLAVRVVATGDIDGDGNVDVYLPSADGNADRMYVNDGAGSFTDQAGLRLPPNTASRSAAARFGDVDGDGDLDLLVAQGYASPDTPFARLFLNDGTGVFAAAAPSQTPTAGAAGGIDPDDIDFLDFDRDFDLDVLINAHAGPSTLWRNDGQGVFTDVSGQLPPPVTTNFHYNPGVCDIDGDDDLDVWIDNIGGAFREQLLRNGGTGVFTDVTSMQVAGNPSADDNGVACVDIDDDGDFDAAIASLSGNERFLLNDGTGAFSLAPDNGFPSVGDPTLWIDFADLDGDGRLDAVTGQGEGNPSVNRIYFGNGNQPLDSTPPRIVAFEAPPATAEAGTEVALRFAVSDRVVTDGGPRLFRAFARVALDGGSPVDATAVFVGGDLFRVAIDVPPSVGTTVSVELCATDPRLNTACAAPLDFTTVPASPGTGGGGGAGGSGGDGGTGGTGGDLSTTTSVTSSGSGVGGGGAAASGTTTAATAGGASPTPPISSEGGGCSCRQAGAPLPSSPSGLWLLLATSGWVWRRRKR